MTARELARRLSDLRQELASLHLRELQFHRTPSEKRKLKERRAATRRNSKAARRVAA